MNRNGSTAAINPHRHGAIFLKTQRFLQAVKSPAS